jgi:hypothetical protein
MPRYLIERAWDSMQEEEMAAKGSALEAHPDGG